MKIRTSTARAAVLVFALSSAVMGEERGDPIETIVVTATRMPIALQDALVPVTVIDRDSIERSGAQDLSELLRFQAALDVVRAGGPGQQTSVFTRGTESNHTLVLVDGVRINSPSIGIAAVEHIAPEMIERVEIVRGPRTSLYGEDAIGGVINVITRRPADGAFGLTAGYGADDTRQASLAAGKTSGALEAGLAVNTLTTDGFPVVEDGSSDQGYDNLTINAFTVARLGPVRAEARFWQSDGTTDYLTQDCGAFPLPCSDLPVDQDYLNQTLALRAALRPLHNWESALEGSLVTDDLDQNQSADFVHTQRRMLDWQNNISLSGGHLLVAGLWLSGEDVEAISFGSPLVTEDTSVAAVYAEDNFTAGPHRLGLAARYSDHDAYDAKITWNAEYGFALYEGLRLIGAAGRALRAPNATERYGSFGGNPDLRPEDSFTLSGGLLWEVAPGHRLGANIYRTRISELIDYALVPDPAGGFPSFELRNIDKAKIHGIETSWEFSGPVWQWQAAALFQDPEDASDGRTLARRSKLAFTASLARRLGVHLVGIETRLTGPREDFAGDLAGYGLVNLTGLIAASDRVKVRLRVENLLDRDYAPAFYDFSRYYAAPSRGLYAELRYDLR